MSLTLPRPWRSVWLPRAVTAAALLAGLPLFLRMPLWCDLTLYDLAARNLLDGGVHYRDVFDTNLPGFVWALAALRGVFGFGAVTLRVADLVIVAGVVLLIDRLAGRGGGTPAARWWAVAGAAVLYPFAVEMAHCQRDTWMALPVLAAVLLRVRRAADPSPRPFAAAALEGALWGAAVWVKPHAVFMAAGVWLVTARRVAGGWRGFAADVLGNLAGGLAVGAAGVLALVASGTWPHFWEVIDVWAPEYADLAGREYEMGYNHDLQLGWFPPWSLWLLPTLPLAALSVLDAVPWGRRPPAGDARPGPVGRVLPGWLWDREAGPDARFARAALAALWFAWACQAYFVQRAFMYVHMAETLLMLGLWAAHRWAVPFVVILWVTVTSLAWVAADHDPAVREVLTRWSRHDGVPDHGEPDRERYLVRHPLAYWERTRHWPDCWRTDLTEAERYALWDRVKRYQDHEASPGWEELAEVAEYLRSRGAGDGEVIAWHDSPHALYLTMNLRPGLRFQHINTVVGISDRGRAQVMAELWEKAGTARFAVSDLGWAALGQEPDVKAAMLAPARGWVPVVLARVGPLPVLGLRYDRYPPKLRNWVRAAFPFNQPAVFRSRNGAGRYVVHELDPPLCDRPWDGDPQGHP
ncbi:MAG: hypothetical protein C0501_20325 [Isosphaera sp.]|nr:hypothetical protein [Isosphaera sp.]